MPPPPQSPYYSADAEQSLGDLAASKYAIPAADGSTVYAIPLDERAGAVARRNGTGAQYMFENPVYAGAAPDNGLSGESKTDTARRPPSSHGAAGPTMLDMMMLEQKFNFYKRAAGGLGLLALVLLIGLVVVASSKTGAAAATVVSPPPPHNEGGVSSSSLSSLDAASAASGVGVATKTSAITTTLPTVATLTTMPYDWKEQATQCAANLETAATCCAALRQNEDLAVGAQCCAASECSGGRQCLSRCCVDGAGSNCLLCSKDGECAVCEKDFYLQTLSGRCVPKLEEGELGCSSANDCTSNRACRGGVCCNEHGAADSATKCSPGTGSDAGDAAACIDGYHVTAGQCARTERPGQPCSTDRECVSGTCRGSVCCNAFGQSLGCVQCAAGSGFCSACATGNDLNANGLCTPPQTPLTTAMTTTITTTTHTPVSTTTATTKTTTVEITARPLAEKSIVIPESGGAKSIVIIGDHNPSCSAICKSNGRTCSDVLLERMQNYATSSASNFCQFVKDVLGLEFDPGNSNVICQAANPHQDTEEHFGLGCSNNAWRWENDFSKQLTGCNSKQYNGGTNTINFLQNSKLTCESKMFHSGPFVHAPQICACNL